MDKLQCESQLQEIIIKHITTDDLQGLYYNGTNFNIITKESWESDKGICFNLMGGAKSVSNFIKEKKQELDNGNWGQHGQGLGVEGTHGSADVRGQEAPNYYDEDELEYDPDLIKSKDVEESASGITQAEVGTNFRDYPIVDTGLYYLKNIGIGLLYIFFSIFLIMFIRYLFGFFYDIFSVNRMKFLRIIVPRGDSKLDREREKELAKDMKEKISRMAQVYRNMHKLGDLGLMDTLMKYLFDKPKIVLIMHYESGMLEFIIGVYPEYVSIIEGSIAAQYSEASIETVKPPKVFKYKFSDIIPMQPIKDSIYPIRVFKQLEDDPINNVIDGIAKIPGEDTFTIQLVMKPCSERFNKKAKLFSDALYKNDESFVKRQSFWRKLLFPWKFFEFLAYGPSQEMITGSSTAKDGYVRMVKAEEEALNTMGDEAGKPAFTSGLLLISSSNNKERLSSNMNNVMSAFSVYRDEYNNSLDQPRVLSDIFGFILIPLWKFSSLFYLQNFFYFKNIFTVNELASVYHVPDGTYNRTPIIRWMDYKVLPPPDRLPVCKDESGYLITGIVSEEYRKGKIDKIFSDVDHRAVGEKVEKEESLQLIEENQVGSYEPEQIVEKDGKFFLKTITEIKKKGLKVFKDGILLGVNVYRNRFSPIYIKREERTRHHYIIGKSGGGKSVFIASMARQDIWNGDGLCVIDPHGDLCEDILEYIPKERAKDIIYFDAGNEERPMGLNLYEIDNIDQADRVVNDATEMFLKMFGPEIFGPRIQEYFKYGSLTLLEDLEDGATLLDVPRLFTDEIFREYKVKKVKNPVVRNFWEKTYNSMGDREKQEIIPYFTAKFVSFNTNRLIRNIIGQTKSAIRFREAMDSGKIILVNLSKGKIGELNAQLLGMIFVAQIYNAAMGRADIPQHERKDFYLYVDEFQNFVSATFADILSEARKYRLSLIMAHQYIAQLEGGSGNNIGEKGRNSVKDAVFGNVGTMQSFKLGAPDAEFLEKEYSPILSAQDIVGISNYKVYIKLNINNATSRVFSMDSIYTKDYRNVKVADILKEYSSKKYGRKRAFVDAEISARLGMLDSFEEELPKE
ncbi:MAG: TraM recognition domain-containing protein [Candidatus Absconditabacteria bacterium]